MGRVNVVICHHGKITVLDEVYRFGSKPNMISYIQETDDEDITDHYDYELEKIDILIESSWRTGTIRDVIINNNPKIKKNEERLKRMCKDMKYLCNKILESEDE